MSILGMVAAIITAAAAPPDQTSPAAALCVKNGATVTDETLPNGGTRAVCVFANGTRIDAGAYFRNKHRTQH